MSEILLCDGLVDEEGVHKPTFWDLLPFVLYRFVVSSIRQARLRREFRKQQKIRQQLLEEEEKREREKELGKESWFGIISFIGKDKRNACPAR